MRIQRNSYKKMLCCVFTIFRCLSHSPYVSLAFIEKPYNRLQLCRNVIIMLLVGGIQIQKMIGRVHLTICN